MSKRDVGVFLMLFLVFASALMYLAASVLSLGQTLGWFGKPSPVAQEVIIRVGKKGE